MIYLFIYPYMLFRFFVELFLRRSIDVSYDLFIYRSLYRSIPLYTYLLIYLSSLDVLGSGGL